MGTAWYKAPRPSAYKGNLAAGLGLGALGLVDTHLIGMAVESGIRAIAKGNVPEWGVDAGRIVGKLAIGSGVSWLIAKGSGKTLYGQFHQAGVLLNVGLDAAGTLIKHILRATSPVSMPAKRMRQNGLDPVSLFGFGEIANAYAESQVHQALAMGHNLIVLQGSDGSYALGDKVAQKILLRGEGKQIRAVVGAAMRATRKGANGLGEDYSVEEL